MQIPHKLRLTPALCVDTMKYRLLSLLLLCAILAGCGRQEEKETFIELIEFCRSTNVSERVKLYSQSTLAWNLGSILSEHNNEKSISIVRNRINTCLEPTVVESYEYSNEEGIPRVRLNYRSAENKEMYIYFRFAEEGGKWVIANTEQGVFNLGK